MILGNCALLAFIVFAWIYGPAYVAYWKYSPQDCTELIYKAYRESSGQQLGSLAFFDSLSEKDRRRYAAVEAEKLGHGVYFPHFGL